MKPNSWICSQLALWAGKHRRIIISAALIELKNSFCSGVIFQFSLYSLDGIKQGMKVKYE
jgi:hypothetical protein